jgi:hypothetical protein
MDLSPSPNSNLGHKVDLRDRLYYDRYEWCIDALCTDAFCLKSSAPDLMTYLFTVQEKWQYRNAARLRTHSNRGISNIGGSWQVPHTAADATVCENLTRLAEMIWRHGDIKPVIHYNWIYLYTNDATTVVQQLKDIGLHTGLAVRQAVINRERGTVLRRDPCFRLRSYFREKRVTEEQKRSLAAVLLNQEDAMISGSMRAWLTDSSSWCRGHFYVDHSSDHMCVLIGMIVPNLLGRTLKIVAINTA